MSPSKIPSKPSAKPGKDVLYIDADDEITTVIDKVEGASNKVVALVLPKRTPVLQSIVNMRLLKRATEESEKNVVLITSESALLPLAGAAGIHVAKNLQSRPEIPPSPSPAKLAEAAKAVPDDDEEEATGKIDYSRPVGELATGAALDEGDAIALGDEDEEAEADSKADKPEKPKKVKGLSVPDFDRFRLKLILGGLGVLLLIVFLILANTVMPKATIAIQTVSSPISASFSMKADSAAKTLDTKKGILPAVLKSSALSTSQNVKASGQKNLGEKATGAVTMTARVCSITSPDPVQAGTGIVANGLAYITQEKANFGGPVIDGSCLVFTSNSVSISAQSGGSNYNVASGTTFTVPSRSDVSASGSASGGTDNNVTVLSQQDIDSVKDKITDDQKTKFIQDFEKQLNTGNAYVLTNTLKSSDPVVTSSSKVGDQVSSADVTVKITYTVLVVSKEDLSKAITEQLETQFDKSKQQIGTEDVVKDATINVQNQTSPKVADLQIIEQSTAIPKIDLKLIKNQIRGQKVGDIRSLIEQWPGVKKVDVNLSPFWVSKAPKNTGKIKIVLTQVKSSNNSNNQNNSGT